MRRYFLARRVLLAGFCILCLLIAGAAFHFTAFSRLASHQLSAHLVQSAWDRTRDGMLQARPLPWLDTTPVARLHIPFREKSFIILKGFSPAVLTYGPGWHDGTAFPGEKGVSLVSAYSGRFSFLKDMELGEEIFLEQADGAIITYKVERFAVAENAQIKVPFGQGDAVLLLSTSLPLAGGVESGQLHLVVMARAVPVPDIS